MVNSVAIENKVSTSVEIPTSTTIEAKTVKTTTVETPNTTTVLMDTGVVNNTAPLISVESAKSSIVDIATKTSVEVISSAPPTVLEISCQGPQGIPGTGIQQINVIVQAGQSQVISLVSLTNAVRWLVYGEDRITGSTIFYEVHAVKSGVDVNYTVSNIIGGGVSEKESVQNTGGGLQLTIVNNGSNDIYYSLVEIGVAAW